MVLYRTFSSKSLSVGATYLEPLKGSIQNPFLGFNNKNPLALFVTRKKLLYGTFWVHSLSFVLSFPD